MGEENDHDEATPAHPEQVVRKLREGERLLNDGKDLTEVLRTLEISEATWNRWRAQYGGVKASEANRLKQLESENARLKGWWPTRRGHRHAQGAGRGKLLTPDRRRRAVGHLRERFGVSERRACRVVGAHRSTHRLPRRDTAKAWTEVNHKRIQRLWRDESCAGRSGPASAAGSTRTLTGRNASAGICWPLDRVTRTPPIACGWLMSAPPTYTTRARFGPVNEAVADTQPPTGRNRAGVMSRLLTTPTLRGRISSP